MSLLTGRGVELLYANTAVGTAVTVANTTTVYNLNNVANLELAHIPADFWLPTPDSIGRGIRVVARGIASSSGSSGMDLLFKVMGGTQGATTTGPILLAATAGGPSAVETLTNNHWEVQGDIIMTAIGAAGVNSTVQGIGMTSSSWSTTSQQTPTATFCYSIMYGGAASPGTVNLDTTVANYINILVTGPSSTTTGQTVTLQQLLIFNLNN
jgi:hypothetical protein